MRAAAEENDVMNIPAYALYLLHTRNKTNILVGIYYASEFPHHQ